MPSTTQALYDLIKGWFPDDHGLMSREGMVLDFLESRGYIEKAGYIQPPVPAHNVSTIEWFCIRYLVEEWDFGFSGTEDIKIKEK